MQQNRLKAPFPYFGGKAMIADLVWHYLGDVKQYIEPFFGSGAVLLRRPQTQHQLYYEIVNDKEGKCYADDADYDTCQHAWRLLEQA